MTLFAPPAVRHLYDDALATLIAWVPPDQPREALRRDFLTALSQDPLAVSKQGPPAHLTASCLVLSEDGTQVLLHFHRKGEMWLQFGGHIEEGDEGLHDAARREAQEESGISGIVPLQTPIDLDRHRLGARFGGCSEHLDVRFVAALPAGTAPLVSDESEAVAWWPVDALPEQVAPDLPRLIATGVRALSA